MRMDSYSPRVTIVLNYSLQISKGSTLWRDFTNILDTVNPVLNGHSKIDKTKVLKQMAA